MAYSKRYVGGFVDLPTKTTPIDSQFLNAVETALLELLSNDGSVDGQALQWIASQSKFGPALLLNKNIDPSAAIDKSKLNLAGQIANADISGAAAIDRSKLNFGAGLVNADLSAAAAIAISKLAGYPSDSTKVLRGDGSWGVGSTTYRKTTAKAVNTTVAATDLLNGEITIGAGVMGTTGFVRLTAIGDFVNNSGGNAAPPRFQLVFGGTTVIDTGAGPLIGAAANRYGWRLVVEILNLGAVNSQTVSLNAVLMTAATTAGKQQFTTGEGQIEENGQASVLYEGVNTSALDTTTSKTLVLNTINGSASASYETKLIGALVEVI